LLFPHPLDFVPQSVDLSGEITLSIRCRHWTLFSNLVVRRCIDGVGQERGLREEEPTAEEELPAEEGVEEGTSEARVPKKDVEA
jgi:hypothetical protein